MGKHNDTGKRGEDLAAQFLEEKNYRLLERNWRHGRAELDIIAMDGKTMVFAEVKTRSDDIFERPENAVKNKKRGLMIKAAIGYMHKTKHENAIRFDILSVILRGGKDPQLDHFKDAFFPDLAE